MNNVLKFKVVCAFVVGFGAALYNGVSDYNDWPGFWRMFCVTLPALIAGFSAVSNFLSTTYAEHKYESQEQTILQADKSTTNVGDSGLQK